MRGLRIGFPLLLAAVLPLACAWSTGGEPIGGGGAPGGGNSGGGNNTGNSGGNYTGPPWVNVTTNLAGIPSECGNMASLFTRPDRDMLIAGIALHGLWASSDGSSQWVQLGQGPGSDEIINRAVTLVYDPVNKDTFWEAGIYTGSGVYRTDDNGVTFKQLGNVRHNDVVSVDLTDPTRKTVLVGGHESPGILFRSRDGGLNYDDIGKNIPSNVGNSSAPHVIDATTFLLGTYNSENGGIFRSTDAGETWTRVHSAGVSFLSPMVAQDGSLYWLEGRSGTLVRSTDKGLTWTKQGGGGSEIDTNLGLAEFPDGRIAAMGRRGLLISADKGVTWKGIGPPLPYLPSGMIYSPFRKAFYIWHFSCGAGALPVPDDAIMRFDFDHEKK